jgi:dihydrofolate reductase
VTAGAFVSLDGVMQAPGGPDEDPTGGFRFGGWTFPYGNDEIGAAMGEGFAKPFDLLLGRRTYDIFAAHWPFVESDPAASGYDEGSHQISKIFNDATKYVATHHPGTLSWANSQALGADVAGKVRELKAGEGPDLLTQGSTELLHILLAADLVDEFKLLIYPVILGKGKRLFDAGSAPRALKVTKSVTAPNGVLIVTYERDGDIRTGSYALEQPSEAEVERQKKLT